VRQLRVGGTITARRPTHHIQTRKIPLRNPVARLVVGLGRRRLTRHTGSRTLQGDRWVDAVCLVLRPVDLGGAGAKPEKIGGLSIKVALVKGGTQRVKDLLPARNRARGGECGDTKWVLPRTGDSCPSGGGARERMLVGRGELCRTLVQKAGAKRDMTSGIRTNFTNNCVGNLW